MILITELTRYDRYRDSRPLPYSYLRNPKPGSEFHTGNPAITGGPIWGHAGGSRKLGKPNYLAYEAKRILSKDPSLFYFSIGQRVRAPIYLGAAERVEGVILEGVERNGKVLYEIEDADVQGFRFIAREEEIEPVGGD